MNKLTSEILVGSMCGDGTIRDNNKYPVFKEAHTSPQRDYLIWKQSMLAELNPKYIEYNQVVGGKKYTTCEIYTPMNKELICFRNLFYPDDLKEKTISSNVLELLGKRGLAVWYLDDGTFNYHGGICDITSCMYDYSVQNNIVRFLKHKYDLDTSIVKRGLRERGQRYSVSFSRESSIDFLNIIKNYIPKCMNYKLGDLCEDNIDKINQFKERHKSYIKDYNTKNAIEISIQKHNYYLKNKEHILYRSSKYYSNNKEKVLSRQRQIRKELQEESMPGNVKK